MFVWCRIQMRLHRAITKSNTTEKCFKYQQRPRFMLRYLINILGRLLPKASSTSKSLFSVQLDTQSGLISHWKTKHGAEHNAPLLSIRFNWFYRVWALIWRKLITIRIMHCLGGSRQPNSIAWNSKNTQVYTIKSTKVTWPNVTWLVKKCSAVCTLIDQSLPN